MRIRRVVAALLVLPLMLLIGDSGDRTAATAGSQTGSPSAAPSGPVAQPGVPAQIATMPPDGAQGVRPDTNVVVTTSSGRLTKIWLRAGDGRAVPGRLGANGNTWRTEARLSPDTTYRLSAHAVGSDGRKAVSRSSFRTLAVDPLVISDVTPDRGETVGVGMPLVVEFASPVTRKAAVERALEVTVSKPVKGAWHWMSDTEVHYRPKKYWPAHSTVTLRANLRGVNAGGGTWGTEDLVYSYKIARRMVSTVNTDSHRMYVYVDGNRVRIVPITAGKEPDYVTRSGIKVVLFKDQYRKMTGTSIGIPKDDPEYFDLDVYWTVAVTWSGEFLHAAPWSAAYHGIANVSHGCVGMSTENGKWFYDHSIRGDVVETVGTSKRMELTNGYGDWNLTWSQWLAGSALR
ncbi:MAG TPA: Ig-like domain-containing protein [Actinomycetes bacterium]|nr:Ig-like domain-containing protein [Actinomycetes bacterium]